MGISVYRSAADFLSFLFHFSVLMIFSRKSFAIDTLTQSQGISVGQTLISSGQMFELGFFSPGNSSKRYIGIWYKNISGQKIVWVANRESPLNDLDTASSLTIGRDGNMRLLDGMKNTVWSTNVSSQPNNTTAVLSDKGDFTLYDNVSGLALWHSFNYPGNTFVTGMSIGINNRTGEKSFLSSWETEDDPSPGIFLCGLTTENPPQAFIWKSSKPYWRSGPWDGWKFLGIPNTGVGYSNGLMVSKDNQRDSVYLTYNSPTLSRVTILFLTTDGILKMTHWDIGSGIQDGRTWNSILVPCDVYGTCGPFGVCDRNGSHTCECLKGFVPKSMEEWTKGNWASGCVRRTELLCEKNASTTSSSEAKNDGFFQLSSMKLPDHYVFMYNVDSSGCRQWCLSNCACKAYAFPAGIGCLVWAGDLVDTQHFSSTGADLFLHVAHSELDEERSMKLVAILTTISGVILLGAFVCGLCWWKVNKRVNRRQGVKEFCSADTEGNPPGNQQGDMWGHRMTQTESSDLPMFDFNTLATATNNFSETNKLGGGGFGPVYKGKLEDGQEIAVKRLSSHSGQGAEEFKNEIQLISKLQHRNLVRLHGYCIKGDEKLLIYEYLKNKSLDTFLFDANSRLHLNWATRLNIIEGIARGLLYLHRDSCLRVIHRDLKASNILLDDNMNPKISDFGLARAFQITQELANTRRVVGTFGYMSPEYAMGGLFSEKSDVFSFGVLLLEIISGMRSTSLYCEEKYNLLGYAWQLWKEERALELMDQALSASCLAADFIHCMHIGLLCIQDHPVNRPTMATLVLMLTSETDIPQPKPPTFYQSLLTSGLRSQFTSKSSVNDVSVSMVEGR